MQSMPGVQGIASGRTLSLGTVVVFGAAYALYQLTSLVLGPAGSRQLDLSLTIPPIEVHDLSDLVAPNVRVWVGTRATPATPVSQAASIAGSGRATSTARPKASGTVLPSLRAKPEPTVAPKPAPAVVPGVETTAPSKPPTDPNDSDHHDDH